MTSTGAGTQVRLRLVLVSGRQHPDFDFAFAAAASERADVLLISPQTAADDQEWDRGRARVLTLPWPRHRHVLASLFWLARVRRAVREFKPDLVHVLSEGQVWGTLLPALVRPAPFVLTLHDVSPHPGDLDTARVPRRLVERFARRADAVIVHGPGLRAAATQDLNLRPDRVHIGRHPALRRYRRIAEQIDAPRPQDGVFRILFFGRVALYKGLRYLLAAEPLIDSAVARRLIVAGTGPSLAADLAAVADHSRIEVRDRRIGDQEAAALFASADVVVLPYLEASQSGVLAIAAAFGLPVIASAVGELGALVAQSGMGLTTPPADPAALAAALSALALDPALRRRCADRARSVADNDLGDEAVWRGAEGAYRFALAAGSSVGGSGRQT
jgi:glycosyltransferase involved in cell wall biosynthesis